MKTNYFVDISKAAIQHRASIISLLKEEKLPVEDLPPVLDNFFVAKKNNKVIGVIGLEQYGNYGLLRSMAVNKIYRNHSVAASLVKTLEAHASDLGINCIYLLTETASNYFERKGYERMSRADVPKIVQSSSEFSHVCPASAIVMKKVLA
jgi:amino-acid N-acetyltransferase